MGLVRAILSLECDTSEQGGWRVLQAALECWNEVITVKSPCQE